MPHFVYTLLLYLTLPLVPFKLLKRGIKQPEYRQHWGERFGWYGRPPEKPVIWIHCVSVGETRASEPLVRLLLEKYPDYILVMSHTTPTGRATSEQLFGSQITRVYLPYDVPFAVKRFLTHFNPKIGLIMETELWFNLIAQCDKRHIPLMLLNARLSEKSARGYAKLGKLVKRGLQRLTLVAAQTTEDEARLRLLGAQNTVVTGNLKFDVTAPEDSHIQAARLRSLLGQDRTVFLAASTRDGEEAMVLDAVAGLDMLTVIVPRHPQRFDEVAALLESRDIPYRLKTELHEPLPRDVQVVLGNTMGEMFTYYGACDFTLVGGSLKKFGGQNLIEAASMGKPILIGKYTYNFKEASIGAVQSGAATQVKDVENLREKIQFLLNHPDKRRQMAEAAQNFGRAKTGVTHRMFSEIEAHLPKH